MVVLVGARVEAQSLDEYIPPALNILADDFAAHGHDLRRLILMIASTEAFRLDSAAPFEITDEHEQDFAVFPLSRLRPEQVIGSSGTLKFEMRDATPVLIKLASTEFVDDKEGKPISIQRIIGRRPLMAFGNSDGDLQMLQWTAAGDGPRFGLLVHHTDADREWAYDRESHVGRLDKALDEARSRGWIVVDMKHDWKTVFAGSDH